jgi:hypothetical protein
MLLQTFIMFGSITAAPTLPLCICIRPGRTPGKIPRGSHGFRWCKMLKTCYVLIVEEIADAKNIKPSYVSRVLRMTLLAPEIAEAILAGRQPEGLTMARAMQPFLLEWKRQEFN